ncbi:MAG: protein-disulfide reductase DsbD [Ignavibacteria bacterium]|nr:protein-disulfide reductase DsbD [Ignavibacteria bacterium]
MNFKKLFLLAFIFASGFSFAQFGLQSDLVKLEIIPGQNKAVQGETFKFSVKVIIEEKWHINSNKPNDEFLIPTELISKNPKFPFTKLNFPKPQELNFEFSEKPVSVYDGEVIISGLIQIDKNLEIGNNNIPIQLKYQACNDQSCMPPTSVSDTISIEVVKVKSEVLQINQETFKNVEQAEPEINVEKSEDSLASTLESSGLILSLLIIFLGGLALNLTPCVYPLIPITIGYFGGQSEGKTSRLFLLGILYVLGMALTYSVVGVVTALSGSVFGSLLQNPFVIVGIAFLFVLLSLSQFGVYEFKLPDSLVAKAGGAKAGTFGAFFMGLTMGIVAAPCIGPFVIGLVTYVAAKGDPFNGFLMFFVLALGLGLPYLVLALFSGKIKKLPRAGDWMEGVKHIFGFLLLGMAIYFVGPILPKEISSYILPMFGLIAAIILLFLDKTANQIIGFRWFKIIFSIIVLLISVYSLIPSKDISPDWKEFSEANYNQSLVDGKKMIIDFYADWCIPCKELDALTFSDSRIVELSKEFDAYKVDMTQTISEETEAIRDKFRILGMPTVLIIDSNGNEIERITGFVNADEFLGIIQKVK